MPRSDIDWLLASVLDGVAYSNEQLELTVFCGGLAVSGTAVSEEAFFEKIGGDSAGARFPTLREENAQQRAEIAEDLGRDDISTEERESLLSRADELQRKFIVMVDVTILGAGPNPVKAPAWRGRLSQISGWVLGTVDESEPSLESVGAPDL